MKHFHLCPECHEKPTCEMDCSTSDEKEPGLLPRGGASLCSTCNPSSELEATIRFFQQRIEDLGGVIHFLDISKDDLRFRVQG